MNETIDTLRGALNRLDELTDPIRLDGDEGDLDAYLYALSKMAESAMERDALGEAHRLRDLQTEMERAEEQGEPVDIRRSDVLRLSVSLHTYREKLLDQMTRMPLRMWNRPSMSSTGNSRKQPLDPR